MVKNINQKAPDRIIADVPIGRLIEPEEVAMLVGDISGMRPLPGTSILFTEACGWGPRGRCASSSVTARGRFFQTLLITSYWEV
jgi:hypothetical protein